MDAEFDQKLFLYLLRWSYDFLKFVNMVYHIDLFACIKESLHSCDKLHLFMVYDPFNALLDWLGSILLRIFVPMFVSDTDL